MRKVKRPHKFKMGEAVVFEPKWAKQGKLSIELRDHPLFYGELVYFITDIPNIYDHCIVARNKGMIIPMIHPEDLRKAKDDEL